MSVFVFVKFKNNAEREKKNSKQFMRVRLKGSDTHIFMSPQEKLILKKEKHKIFLKKQIFLKNKFGTS